VLAAVIVLILAICRHLVAHRSESVKFAKAVHAAIEPLTSDVVEGGSCTTGQPSISAHTDASFARDRERHGGITVGVDHAEVDDSRRAKENKRHNLHGWLHAFVSPCVRSCLC
jgi:hypothetical protein